jgi:hypothetical protein
MHAFVRIADALETLAIADARGMRPADHLDRIGDALEEQTEALWAIARAIKHEELS